jgi:hypothetical protein
MRVPVSMQRAQQKQSSTAGWDDCGDPTAASDEADGPTFWSCRQHCGFARSYAVHASRTIATMGATRWRRRITAGQYRGFPTNVPCAWAGPRSPAPRQPQYLAYTVVAPAESNASTL